MPLAANDDDDTDTFQDVSQNYFIDVSEPQDNFGNYNQNDFTPEKITQKDLLRNAQNNSVKIIQIIQIIQIILNNLLLLHILNQNELVLMINKNKNY